MSRRSTVEHTTQENTQDDRQAGEVTVGGETSQWKTLWLRCWYPRTAPSMTDRLEIALAIWPGESLLLSELDLLR